MVSLLNIMNVENLSTGHRTGGESDQGALTAVESYLASTDTWTELPAIPMPRAGTQGASIGQQLYVPGGAVELKFEPTDTLFVYRPD